MRVTHIVTTAEQIEREWYGWNEPYSSPDWRVTHDAKLLHDCGHWVYSERTGSRPAALPFVCWYCGGAV